MPSINSNTSALYSVNAARKTDRDMDTSMQRLSSGNTLIAEGGKGCIFEVTPECEVVWEYINPFYGPHGEIKDGEINWVFRAKRYASNSPEIAGRV